MVSRRITSRERDAVRRMRPMLRLPFVSLLSLLALACGGSQAKPESARPGQPAPPAVLGTASFTVDAGPDRVLPAIAWYPAEKPGEGAPPVAGRKLPVLVMSHGLGGKKEHASFLAERVAAAGYLVVAIDHVNDGVELALQRPVDVSKTLDRLAEHGSEPDWLADLADLEHVAVYGHSFGGFTALVTAGALLGPNPEWTAYCAGKPAGAFGCPPPPGAGKQLSLRDPRVDLAIGAAPAGFIQFGRAGTAAVATPVVLIGAGKDRLTTLAEYVRPLFDNIKQPRWILELEQANHFTFVDVCAKQDKIPAPFNAEVAEACAPDAPLPLRTAHLLIGDVVVAALDHTLKGGPAPDLAALAKARETAARADAAR
jgi:predicted dienelactone hydrolase